MVGEGASKGRHALVLAGGAGSRFGGGKMLAEWRGEPLILAAIRKALKAHVETVILVTGSEHEALARLAAGLHEARLVVVQAHAWAGGISASLIAGIAALPDDARAVVVLLGDMPLIPEGLVDRVLDAVEQGALAAVVTSPLGPAHPAAFSRATFEILARLEGDRGARGVLAAFGDAAAQIASDDPGVVFDVDRPADLQD
jgi:molybdenum cofactor cytidylyltransferase